MKLALLVALALASSIASAQSGTIAPCSPAGLAGFWGFTVTGSRVGVGDIAAVGSFRLRADGTISAGTQTTSLGGKIFNETFVGTFTMASNCSGTASIAITSPAGRLAHFSVVTTEAGRQLRMIFTDPGTISVIEATRR